MRNIIKDIKTNCAKCDTIEGVVMFLKRRGDFKYTSEFYREVWFFYLESISLYDGDRRKRSKAAAHTCEMMSISDGTFRRIRLLYK
jgi:hypothetical protein